MNIKEFKGRVPYLGDKIILLDSFYELLTDGKECAKLAKLPYCTIESAILIPIGNNGDYTYTYEIYINESNYMIGLYKDSWDFY